MREERNYWQQIQHRRLGRRALLRGAALGAAGLAAAATLGCEEEEIGPTPAATSPAGGASPAAGTPAATPTPGVQFPPPPKYSNMPAQQFLMDYHWSKVQPQAQVLGTPRMGGVISLQVWGLGSDSMHPEGTSPSGQPFAAPMLLSNLVMPDWRANPDSTPATTRYSLSESFETPDASTFIFKLRKGVRFHDIPPASGAELTVADIQATYDFYKTKSKFHALNFKTISTITEPQPGVVKITTSEPSVHLLNTLKNATYGVLNAKHLEEGEEALKNKAIGTGHFVQYKFTPNLLRAYKRNPNWWWPKDAMGNQQPYLDGLVQKVIRDIAAAVAAFRTGQIDYYRPVSVEEWQRLQKELDTWAIMHVRTTGLNSFLATSLRTPLLQDVRVRRALALAINYQELIDLVFNGAASTADWIPWYFRGLKWPQPLEEMGPWYKYDPQGARNLLSQAGVQAGTKLQIIFQGQLGAGGGASGAATGDPYAELVRKYLRDIGLDAYLEPVDAATKTRTFYDGKWTGLMVQTSGHGVHAVDPDNWVQTAASGSGINAVGVNDSRVDELFKKQRAAVDPEERAKVLQDLEVYVNRDQLFFGPQLPTSFSFALWRKWLHNTIEGPTWAINGGLMTHTSEWWLDGTTPSRDIDAL